MDILTPNFTTGILEIAKVHVEVDDLSKMFVMSREHLLLRKTLCHFIPFWADKIYAPTQTCLFNVENKPQAIHA